MNTPPPTSRKHTIITTVVLFGLGYGLLVALAGYPIITTARPAIPMAPQVPGWLPGDGDPLYRLWWIDWLWSHPATLAQSGVQTRLFFAPFGGQLGLMQAQLFQGLLVLALMPLGDPARAYCVLWALSFLFAAGAAAALAWDVSRSRAGAFLAGGLTAFSSPFFVHSLEHVVKYLGFGFVPLALLCLRRVMDSGSRRAYLALFICSAMIVLSDWYNALYVVVGGAILWLHRFATAVEGRRQLLKRTAATFGLLPPLALILWWTLAPVLARESGTLRASLSEQADFSVDALNIALPHPYHPFFGALTAERLHALPGNVFEKTAYFGWLLPMALLALVWRDRRDPTLRPWLWLFAIFFVLALGPSLQWSGRSLLPLPGAWIGTWPGFAGSRAPGRYVVVCALILSVITSILISRLRRPVLAAIVLGALALVEIAPFAAPVVALEPSPTLKRLAAEADDDAVLDIPFRYAMQRYILDQTLHRRPLVNGYMIRFTPRYVAHPSDVPGFELMRDPETLPKDCDGLRLAFALTRLLGVRYIVLHKRYVSGRAVPNLLASGLPLERVDEDAQVILFRLDRARILAADASSFDAGAAESSGRRLTLGFSPGGVWPNGRQFLWSEETESAIALAPPAGTRNVNVELLAYEAAAAGRPVQAIVTTSDSSQQVALTGGWTEVRIPVPANQTDPLILRFRTPSCARPADIEPRSADKRCLALGLARIAWTR